MANVVVLVLLWNGRAFLRACLSALLDQDYAGRYAILAVDNGSTDGSADQIQREFPAVALLRNERNLGFAGGNNAGLRALLRGDVPGIDSIPTTIVLLNQDTEVAPDWLRRLIEVCERHPQAGIVGCKIYFPGGHIIQHAGGQLVWPLATGLHRGTGERDTGQYDIEESAEYVTGAAMAVRTLVFDTIGLLDEGFTPAYYEDSDLCLRARAAGFDVVYAPTAQLIHHESTSLSAQSPAHQRAYHRNRIRFVLKHGRLDRLRGDFVPAEQAEIGRWSLADSLARKHAYVAGLLALPEVLSQRKDIPDRGVAWAWLADVLRQLHQAVVDEETHRRRAELMGGQTRTHAGGTATHDAQEDHLVMPKEGHGMSTADPIEPSPAADAPVDVAEIMRQVRRRIAERQDRSAEREVPQVFAAANQQWDQVYEPLRLPPGRSPLGRAWEVLRVRLHQEVRSYLDPMIFRQTEFNSSVVRALNILLRRTQSTIDAAEIEALRDEVIRLRAQVQRLEEQRAK